MSFFFVSFVLFVAKNLRLTRMGFRRNDKLAPVKRR